MSDDNQSVEKLQERINMLERQVQEFNSRLSNQEKENHTTMASFMQMMGRVFIQQGTQLRDKLEVPAYQLKRVDGINEKKNDQTITIVIEDDDSFTVLYRDGNGNLIPQPQDKVVNYPIKEFLKSIGAEADTTVHANIYRVQGEN